MKVSFDFDSTLSSSVVQKLSIELIKEDHEVWIVTSRFEKCDSSGNNVNNDDLFEVADELGIPRNQIHFCNMVNKWNYLKDKGFLWHLDDDSIELYLIRLHTDVFPIYRHSGNDWWNQCNDLIRIIKEIYNQVDNNENYDRRS